MNIRNKVKRLFRSLLKRLLFFLKEDEYIHLDVSGKIKEIIKNGQKPNGKK